jgi:hypothetical protein
MSVENNFDKEKLRAKLYILDDEGKWKDCGTGWVDYFHKENVFLKIIKIRKIE